MYTEYTELSHDSSQIFHFFLVEPSPLLHTVWVDFMAHPKTAPSPLTDAILCRCTRIMAMVMVIMVLMMVMVIMIMMMIAVTSDRRHPMLMHRDNGQRHHHHLFGDRYHHLCHAMMIMMMIIIIILLPPLTTIVLVDRNHYQDQHHHRLCIKSYWTWWYTGWYGKPRLGESTLT